MLTLFILSNRRIFKENEGYGENIITHLVCNLLQWRNNDIVL